MSNHQDHRRLAAMGVTVCVLMTCLITAPASFVSTCTANELKVEKRDWGQTEDGETVELYTLTNTNGIEAKVMTLGATLTTVKTPDRDGNFAFVTLYNTPPYDLPD